MTMARITITFAINDRTNDQEVELLETVEHMLLDAIQATEGIGHIKIVGDWPAPDDAASNERTTPDHRERLEQLRQNIRAESISYGELAELQDLAEHIDPGDIELLEAAGVPEFPGETFFGEPLRKTKTDLRDAILSELDATYELVHVAYDDRFTDTQIEALVAGQWERLFESFEEWEADGRYDSVQFIITELAQEVITSWEAEGADCDGLERHFDQSDEWDEVRDEIENRDSSDWMKDLASNSGSVLLRIPIPELDEDHAFSFEEVDPAEVLDRVGFELTEHNLSEAAAMLNECSPEFSVLIGYWIVGIDVSDLYDLMKTETTEVEITNPFLFMGNPFAGSGYMTDSALTGVARVKREDLRTDKGAFGYSVNEIFGGLSASSFEAEIKAVPITSATNSEQENTQ